jgi:hypothetical protein
MSSGERKPEEEIDPWVHDTWAAYMRLIGQEDQKTQRIIEEQSKKYPDQAEVIENAFTGLNETVTKYLSQTADFVIKSNDPDEILHDMDLQRMFWFGLRQGMEIGAKLEKAKAEAAARTSGESLSPELQPPKPEVPRVETPRGANRFSRWLDRLRGRR